MESNDGKNKMYTVLLSELQSFHEYDSVGSFRLGMFYDSMISLFVFIEALFLHLIFIQEVKTKILHLIFYLLICLNVI